MKKVFYSYYLRNVFRKNIAFSAKIQCLLQWFGIAIHNPWRDECCVDFGCCCKKDHCWLQISSKMLPIKRTIYYRDTAPIGTPGRTFRNMKKFNFDEFAQFYCGTNNRAEQIKVFKDALISMETNDEISEAELMGKMFDYRDAHIDEMQEAINKMKNG